MDVDVFGVGPIKQNLYRQIVSAVGVTIIVNIDTYKNKLLIKLIFNPIDNTKSQSFLEIKFEKRWYILIVITNTVYVINNTEH